MSVPFSYSFDPIKDSLTEAGFTDINAAVVKLKKDVPDAASFAQGLVYGSPLIDQIRARKNVEPDQIIDALVRNFHHEFGLDPGCMPLQAIVFSARKSS